MDGMGRRVGQRMIAVKRSDWTVLGGFKDWHRSSPGLRERARIGDGADARRVIEGDASIGRDRTAPSELLSRFPRMDVMPD